MKSLILLSSILFSTTLFAQESKPVIYKGKIGLSTIVFNHDVVNGSSTAELTTGRSKTTYNYCSEDDRPKVQKLCLFDSKKGYDVKKNMKINLPFGAKKTPKTITGTYFVNGAPVKFNLVRSA